MKHIGVKHVWYYPTLSEDVFFFWGGVVGPGGSMHPSYLCIDRDVAHYLRAGTGHLTACADTVAFVVKCICAPSVENSWICPYVVFFMQINSIHHLQYKPDSYQKIFVGLHEKNDHPTCMPFFKKSGINSRSKNLE